MKRYFWILAAVCATTSMATAQDLLTLDAFLGQVKNAPVYRSASETVDALLLQKEEPDLAYSTKLVAHAKRNDNRDDQVLTTLYDGNELNELIHRAKTDDYGASLVKKWKYGFTTALNYDWTRVDSTADSGQSTAFQVQPSASVTLPLWRDFLGKQSVAQTDQTRYQTESSQFSAAHQREEWLYKARTAYWDLQLARDTVDIRRDTLARAVSIVAWSQRRSNLRLGDDTELVQARAAQRVRELELQEALESAKTACIDFNRFRGVEDEEVPEALERLETSLAGLIFNWPKTAPRRWDVKASEAQVETKKAAWKAAKADAQPDLNAFASIASNGADSSYAPANDESTKVRRPNSTIGVELTIPLDVMATQKVAKGYERNYKAALLEFEDKVLQTQQEWKHLQQRLNDVDQRLGMSKEIEALQKEKVEKEQQRLRAGRTTQYQVQSYEGDYSSARLQYLSIQAEKLSLWAEGEWILSAEREWIQSAKNEEAAWKEGVKQ